MTHTYTYTHTTWIEFKNIILNENEQSQLDVASAMRTDQHQGECDREVGSTKRLLHVGETNLNPSVGYSNLDTGCNFREIYAHK